MTRKKCPFSMNRKNPQKCIRGNCSAWEPKRSVVIKGLPGYIDSKDITKTIPGHCSFFQVSK